LGSGLDASQSYLDCQVREFEKDLARLTQECFADFLDQFSSTRDLLLLLNALETKGLKVKREHNAREEYRMQVIQLQFLAQKNQLMENYRSTSEQLFNLYPERVPRLLRCSEQDANHYPIIDKLEQIKMGTFSQALISEPNTGNTLLHYAMQVRQTATQAHVSEEILVVLDAASKMLIEQGADWRVVNATGDTPNQSVNLIDEESPLLDSTSTLPTSSHSFIANIGNHRSSGHSIDNSRNASDSSVSRSLSSQLPSIKEEDDEHDADDDVHSDRQRSKTPTL